MTTADTEPTVCRVLLWALQSQSLAFSEPHCLTDIVMIAFVDEDMVHREVEELA